MKKIITLAILSAALATPAQAEITGYFEDNTRPSVTHQEDASTPSFMSTVLNHKTELELSEKQQAALALYQEDNARHMRFLIHKAAVLEKSSRKHALKGTDKNKIMAKIDQATKLRKEIASNKLACRDNVRSVLTDFQWKKLVTLYKIDHIKHVSVAYPSEGLGTN